jgi:glyoxylase-like metal-dependent hydrolase (beta-lactamase superfamily II)
LAVWGSGQVAQTQQNGDLDVLRIRPNFYVIAGGGSNIAVQTGPDGAVVVDAGSAEAADRVVAALQKITADAPIRFVIDTSADADHVGGNARVAKAGRSIFNTGTEPIGGAMGQAMTSGFAASIMAHERVLFRMSAPTGQKAAFTSDAWPVETFSGRRKDIYLNGEGIQIFHELAAHGDSDSVVLFRASDVVVAGDIIDANRFPVIDLEKGGSIQGEIAALNHVIELSVRPVPFVFEGGGTYVVPGHGRIYDKSDAVDYRDMIVTIRDVIQDMIRRGMTLDQVKAAAPAKPYELQYGSKSGPWTTDNFVEAVYRSLTAKK